MRSAEGVAQTRGEGVCLGGGVEWGARWLRLSWTERNAFGKSSAALERAPGKRRDFDSIEPSTKSRTSKSGPASLHMQDQATWNVCQMVCSA